MRIAQKDIGPGHPCYIVAEIGMAHDGRISTAHELIDLAAGAGVDAIKFQTHIADAESTSREPFRTPGALPDASRYEYWRRTEFAEGQWAELVAHARAVDVEFLSSPFSVRAARLLTALGVTAWKIASGEVDDEPLLQYVAATRLPVVLSTGLSTIDETEALVTRFQACGSPVAVLQCTTEYPSTARTIGLDMIATYRRTFACPVGLSDHSGQAYAGIAAVAAYAADIIEVHIALSDDMPGPDTRASLTPQRLSQLVEGIRFVEATLSCRADKSALSTEQQTLRRIFGHSLVAARALPAGHLLRADDLAAKKPGGGIAAARMGEFVGRRLARPLLKDEPVRDGDAE